MLKCLPLHSTMSESCHCRADAHFALDDFFHKVGIPHVMISDGAKEQVQGQFRKKCRRAQCPLHPIEPYTPNANLVEGVIRELKRHYRRVMTETGAPEVLWDYCLEWCAHVRSNLALNIGKLDGQTPATMMTGDTADISHIAEFGWCWMWQHLEIHVKGSLIEIMTELLGSMWRSRKFKLHSQIN